jgi:hypothetical protein
VGAPNARDSWCAFCTKQKDGSKNCTGCLRRKQLELIQAGVAASPVTAEAGPRTRSAVAASVLTPPPAASRSPAPSRTEEPAQLEDLLPTAPERRISADPNVAVVFVTSSAFAAEGDRGRFLRLALP